jgi:YD repeat-containing protein
MNTMAQVLHDPADGTYGTWNFSYDDLNLVSVTNPNSDVITYGYDDLHRVISEDSNTTGYEDVAYVYDSCTNGVGKVCTVSNNAATSTYSYYKQGGVQSESVATSGNTYAKNNVYNRQNQLTSITYPNSDVVTYTYTVNGLPKTVSVNGVGQATSTYGVHAKVTSSELKNGLTTDYLYNKEDLYSLENKITGMANALIPVTTYSTTTVPSYTDTKFFDDFQGDPTQQWTESTEFDWQTEVEALVNVPGSTVTNKVMHADDCDNLCVITTTNSINLTGASSAQLTFWRFTGVALESNEYLKIQLFNGTQWIEVASWGPSGNTWHSEALNITSYIGPNFKVRLMAKMDSNGEYVEIDDIKVIATYPTSYTVSSSTEYINGYAQKIQDLIYTYDDTGNITSIVDDSESSTKKTQSFTYDDLYRLTGVTTTNVASGTSAYTQSFTYSPVGNITPTLTPPQLLAELLSHMTIMVTSRVTAPGLMLGTTTTVS